MSLFDPRTSALVMIDLQGAVHTHGAEPYSPDEVIERCVKLIDATRRAGGLVVHVRTSFLPDESDSLQPLVIEKMRAANPERPEGWDQLVPEVAPLPSEPVIVKRSWNAFHGSDLDLQLRRHGVKTVIMAGMSTNFGVEGTARAAYEHYYDIVFVEEAMSTNTATNHQFALAEIFPQIGRVRSLAEVLDTLNATSK
ncbi:isochorismatase family protein [Microbacterium sp. YY-01]|uniref:isochorismatase family protein n=1 Tax=Microbacterium sp. YY-01 TaxID=3421634 RepID=UPI003D183636